MKAFIILALVLAQAIVSSSWAQSARQLTRRITGEGKPIPPPPAPPPRPAAPPSPASTALPAPPPKPVDPAQAAAAKAEKQKNTVEFLQRRVEQGSPSAKYDLGVRYLYGDGVEQDYARGRKLLEESAQSGNKQAVAKLQELKQWEERAAKEKK